MPPSCGYQCTDLPNHEQVICGEYLKGGISSIGILECDHSITDFTSAVQATTAINNNQLTIIEPVVGEVPAPSPVEGTNPSGCGSATILDSFDRTATWNDYNVSDSNVNFYNALNRRKAYLVLYHCNDDNITVVDQSVSFSAMRIVPNNQREKQYFQVTAKWTSLDEAAIYDAPAGIYSI